MYRRIVEVAQEQDSQIIVATHSEVVLNEAADRDVVIAFVGKPHRIDDRGSQVSKSLKEIGFEQYYLAELNGWVLYLEGATDLRILQAFASTLKHPAEDALAKPFVHYVANNARAAKSHFHGLREAKKDLVGFALYDRSDKIEAGPYLRQYMWKQREIENYLCFEKVLIRYAEVYEEWDLFRESEINRKTNAMREAISEMARALKTLKKPLLGSSDLKASDDYLDPLFELYFQKLNIENLLRKSDYHLLAKYIQPNEIDREVTHVLDQIVMTSEKAKSQ